MRPEPREPGVGCAAVLLLSVILGMIYFVDTKPRKEYVKRETKPVLDSLHKRAIDAVDTIDFNNVVIDVKSARRDSAHLTKQMLNIMDGLSGHSCYYDYKCDSTTIRDLGNGRKTYWCKGYFNVNKAMRNNQFAKTYRKYYETIKQLEIARRQVNHK